MTSPNNINRNNKTLVATSGQTVFQYDFWTPDNVLNSEIYITQNNSLLLIDDDYTINLVTKVITLTVGATTGDTFEIYRLLTKSREDAYILATTLTTATVNGELDRFTAYIQELIWLNNNYTAIYITLSDTLIVDFFDQDDMAANSATAVASQQSIKAYVDAVSVIIATKQALNDGLTSISGLTTAADKMIYTTASDTYAVTGLTSFARTLLDDADAATARGTLGLAADVHTFTTSGTWTKPAGGATRIRVQLWGGGGSGGNGSLSYQCGGGGGGGYIEYMFDPTLMAGTETVTVGIGGARQTGAAIDGNAGGDTTFGILLTAGGGGGGGAHSSTNGGGGGGGGGWRTGSVSLGISGGISGGLGGNGSDGTSGATAASDGGHSYNTGAGGGGASDTGQSGDGGNSQFGGSGGGGSGADGGKIGIGGVSEAGGGTGGDGGYSNTVAGTDGTVPGGGGGGNYYAAGGSGAGADGQCIVTTYF